MVSRRGIFDPVVSRFSLPSPTCLLFAAIISVCADRSRGSEGSVGFAGFHDREHRGFREKVSRGR